MRRKMQQIICWLHATLIFALIAPFLYALDFSEELRNTGLVYAKALLIVLPIAITYLAVRYCRSLFTYLLTSLLVLAGMTAMVWFLGGIGAQTHLARICDTVLLAIETLLIIALRFRDRMQKIQEEREKDPYWQPKESFLNRPGFQGLWYFGVIYLLGLGFSSVYVCNEAFYSGILYVILVFIYQFIGQTETYFSLNKDVSRVPAKRIYGISAGMLGVFLLCFVLAAVPAAIASSYRPYTDIRNWFAGEELVTGDWFMEYGELQSGQSDEIPDWMLAAQEDSPKLPDWINAVFQGIVILIFAALLLLVCRQIREIFHNFRRSYDENGDRIEELTEDGDIEHFLPKEEARAQTREEIQIRRRYKKEIRRRRKEQPGRFESPAEMEHKAGLQDRELHELYEAARYSNMGDKHKI